MDYSNSPPSFATPHISKLIRKRASVARPLYQASTDSLPPPSPLDGLAASSTTGSPSAQSRPQWTERLPVPLPVPVSLPVIPLRSPRRDRVPPSGASSRATSPSPQSAAESTPTSSNYSPNEQFTIARAVRQTPGQHQGQAQRNRENSFTANSVACSPADGGRYGYRKDAHELEVGGEDDTEGNAGWNEESGELSRRDSVFGGPRLRRFDHDPDLWDQIHHFHDGLDRAQTDGSSSSLARAGVAFAGKLMGGLSKRNATFDGSKAIFLPDGSDKSLSTSLSSNTITASDASISTSSSVGGLATPGRAQTADATNSGSPRSARRMAPPLTPSRPAKAAGRVPVPPVTASMYDPPPSIAPHPHSFAPTAPQTAPEFQAHFLGQKRSQASLRTHLASAPQVPNGFTRSHGQTKLNASPLPLPGPPVLYPVALRGFSTPSTSRDGAGGGAGGGVALISLDIARQRQASRSTSGSASITENTQNRQTTFPIPETRLKSRKSGLLKLFAKADRDRAPPLPPPISIGEPFLISSTKSLPSMAVAAVPRLQTGEVPRSIVHRGRLTASPAQVVRIEGRTPESRGMPHSATVESIEAYASMPSRDIRDEHAFVVHNPGSVKANQVGALEESGAHHPSPVDRPISSRVTLPLPQLELRPVSMIFSRALPPDYLLHTPSPPRTTPRQRSPTAPGALSPLKEKISTPAGSFGQLGREAMSSHAGADAVTDHERVEELHASIQELQAELGRLLDKTGRVREARCAACGCTCRGDAAHIGRKGKLSVMDRGRVTSGASSSLFHGDR